MQVALGSQSFVDEGMLERLSQQYNSPAKKRGNALNVLLNSVEQKECQSSAG